MRRWKTQSSLSLWIGLVLLLAALAGTAYLGAQLFRVFNAPPETWPFDLRWYSRDLLFLGLVLLCATLLYRVIATLTLGYELDRNGLYITWMRNRAVVPLDQIQTVEQGAPSGQIPWSPFHGIGYYRGQGRTADGKKIVTFATRSPRQCLAIHTPSTVYLLSPADRESFVQELEQRRNLGATKSLSSTIEAGSPFTYAYWSDHTIQLLVLAACVVNLLVLAYLAARYPSLASTVELRFNSAGEAAELRPRYQLLFLPLAAFGLGVANTLLGIVIYRRQQIGAQLLQASSVIVQILFGIAVATAIR